jgi:ABC-type branched-subunit amino acid transport system substrate-binding protein
MQRILRQISLKGVSGTIRFDNNGNAIDKPILILRGNDDGRATIDTSLQR